MSIEFPGGPMTRLAGIPVLLVAVIGVGAIAAALGPVSSASEGWTVLFDGRSTSTISARRRAR